MRIGPAICVIVSVLMGCEHLPWEQPKPPTTQPATRPAKPAVEREPTTSLYDRMGGEKAIGAVVEDFIPRAAGDAKVNFTRQGTGHEWPATPANVDKVKARLIQFFCVATGGPQRYEGQDMGTAHKSMKITDAEFDALAADLKASLDELKIPQREQKELLDIVASTRGVIVEKP